MNTESCIKLKKKYIKKQNQYLAVEEKAQTWRLLLFRSGVGGTLISLLISILLVQLTTGCCYGLLCRKSFFFFSLHSIIPRPKITSASKLHFCLSAHCYSPPPAVWILLFCHKIQCFNSALSAHSFDHRLTLLAFFFFMSLRSSSCETDHKKIFFSHFKIW